MAKLIVFCLLAIVPCIISCVNAVECGKVLANLSPCKNYLSNLFPHAPSSACCNAATALIESADSDSLCQCFMLNPMDTSILSPKAQQLPNLCNVSAFSPLVNCLSPSKNVIIPGFPPFNFPFPPVVFPFPVPPMFPIPPGDVPNLPQLPLPPVVIPGAPQH